jgi:archaellum biogenesis protein FlaJ (TadC family)
VLHSWVEYIKIAFIFLQVLVLTYLFVEAILSRLRKTGQYDIVSFMFAADIVILCALCYFDWGKKLIACFFFMIFFQNFIAVVGLYHMCHGLKTPERKHLRRKTGIYFSLVTMVYLIVFIMTFTKTMGPICTKTDLYPPVMDISNGLFVLNALFHFYAHSQDYWLKWEEHPLIQPYVGKEEEMDWEPISILKQKF